MSRGLLDSSELMRISKEIPELSDFHERVRGLSPDFISTIFAPESNVPLASVCLQDAVNTYEEARYALHEVFAHRMWYLEKKEPPNKEAAIFFSRFYADDAALRLYAAGEHLANGIIMMLEIDHRQLKPYKKKRISQQSAVGHFLLKQKAHHPITKTVTRLVDSKEWCDTMEYRNRWVHEQPPTVEGLGIIYKRGRRWRDLPTGKEHVLCIGGGGDAPEYSIHTLVRFTQCAMFQFSDTLTSVIECYVGLLESRGMRFDRS
jgi:hypothetical protein